jgi:hypothetical protein
MASLVRACAPPRGEAACDRNLPGWCVSTLERRLEVERKRMSKPHRGYCYFPLRGNLGGTQHG